MVSIMPIRISIGGHARAGGEADDLGRRSGEGEDLAERRRADDDHEDHAGDLHGIDQRGPDHLPADAAVDRHHHQRADHADGGRLGGRGNAEQHHAPYHQGDDQHRADRERRADALAPGIGRFGYRRGQRRIEPHAHDDIGRVERGQQQARDDARDQQVADRNLRQRSEQNPEHARRDDHRQTAAAEDRPERHLLAVAAPAHFRRQGGAEHRHARHRRAAHRAEQRAGGDRRPGQGCRARR